MKRRDSERKKAELKQRNDALDALEQYYRGELTDDTVKNARDIVRGARTRGGADPLKWREKLREVNEYFQLTRLWQKIAWRTGALTAGLALLLFLLWSPTVEVHTPSGRGTAEVRLPETLRFQFGKARASLQGKGFALVGNLAGTPRRGGMLTIIDATFTGSAVDGTRITFTGSLVLTNAPGIVNVRSRKDFVGACLKGQLTIGTNAPIAYEQPYMPE